MKIEKNRKGTDSAELSGVCVRFVVSCVFVFHVRTIRIQLILCVWRFVNVCKRKGLEQKYAAQIFTIQQTSADVYLL